MFKLQEADSADYPAVIAMTKRRLELADFGLAAFVVQTNRTDV